VLDVVYCLLRYFHVYNVNHVLWKASSVQGKKGISEPIPKRQLPESMTPAEAL